MNNVSEFNPMLTVDIEKSNSKVDFFSWKIGDNVVCYSNKTTNGGYLNLTLGKSYKIIGLMQNTVEILNDADITGSYYAFHFNNVKNLRKKKLKKIYEKKI